jgi:AraC-like DNA-binding protein
VLQAASEVGYNSEAAFNRAFKREFGIPPGQFRRSASRSGSTDGDRPTRTRLGLM